jgi:hypothetical protein
LGFNIPDKKRGTIPNIKLMRDSEIRIVEARMARGLRDRNGLIVFYALSHSGREGLQKDLAGPEGFKLKSIPIRGCGVSGMTAHLESRAGKVTELYGLVEARGLIRELVRRAK